MKKRLLAMLIVLTMLLPLCLGAYAKGSPVITVFVDGSEIKFDVPPTSENGRTLVPLRYIFEALGAEVEWIQEENKAVATKGSVTVEVILNSSKMYRNGEKIALDVPAKAIDGRILVPARAVAEAFDADVKWLQDKYRVVITSAPAGKSEASAGSEAEARKVLNQYIDACEKLDIRRIMELTVNGSQALESLPEGDITDILTSIMISEVVGTDELVELPENYAKKLESFCHILIDGMFGALTKDLILDVSDVREENGKYIYTTTMKMRNFELLADDELSQNFALKLSTAVEKETTKLIESGKITDTMSEDEIAIIMLEPMANVIVKTFTEEISKLEFTTLTEDVTLVNIQGKWLIEDAEIDLDDFTELFEIIGY